MRSKSLVILGAITLILAVIAAMVVSKRGVSEAPKPAAAQLAPLFPGLRDKVTDVARIKIKRGAVEAVVARSPGDKPTWVVENRGNYPCDFDHVRQLVGALAEAVIVETKTSKPEYYDRIGVGDVDKPGALGTKVETFDAAGKPIAALIIGNTSHDTGSSSDPTSSKPCYFVRLESGPQTYLARGEFSVQPDPMTWVNRAFLPLEAAKVRSTTVTRTNPDGTTEKLSASKNAPQETKYTLENLPAGRQLKDEFAASRMAQAIAETLTMDDVAPATGMDFSKPEVVVESKFFDGQVITAKMITKDGKKWFAFEAAYEEPPAAGAPATPASPATPEAPKPETPAADTTKPGESADQAKETAAKAEAAKVEAAKAEAAKALAGEKAAAIKHVAEVNEKLGPWAFVLPDYKVTSMAPKLDDLLKAPDTAPPVAPAGGPGGSLLGPH